MRRLATTGTLAAAAALALTVSAGPASSQGFSVRVAARLQAANAPVSQLERVAERRSFGATFVHVRQVVAGIPVLGSSATLSLSSTGLDLLLDHTRRALARPPDATVSRSAAISRARRVALGRRTIGTGRASLALLPSASGARLVWRVLLRASEPAGDFEVLVDARSRAVVRVRNLIKDAAGQARVFDPNPIVEQGSRSGLFDDNNKDSTVLDALYRPVTLLDLDPGGGCPSGAWVNTLVGRGSTCPAGRDFNTVTRASVCGCFEAAMAYFHLDRTQRYIQSLGFNNIVHRAIPVHLHATADDNSFFRPSDGSLYFGDGGVNDAQDADVINHEYGHAIQDSQAPGFGDTIEGGAIGEGWGDYWQAVQSANQGNPDQFNVCFAEWDTSEVSSDPIPCLRRVDLEWTLQQARRECPANEIHCVGQAWSNALWTIRKQLGGAATDRLVLQSQFSYTPLTGFADASRALLFADQQLNGGANQAVLKSLLMARGFVTEEQLDDEPSGAHPLAVPGRATGHLSSSNDERDVLSVLLTARRGVVIDLHAGGSFTLTLYGPGTKKIVGSTSVKGPTKRGTHETLAYVAPSSGTYYLSVDVPTGSADYTVEAFLDTDGDGRADATDNCPAVANPSQADWNRNGEGDACDPSSKTSIEQVTLRGHQLRVVGALRPSGARAASWMVEARRGKTLVASARGATKTSRGRVSTVVVIPARTHGRLQVRAVLDDPRYDRALSKAIFVNVP